MRDILCIISKNQKKTIHVAEKRDELADRYVQYGPLFKYDKALDAKIFPQVGKDLIVNLNAVMRPEDGAILFDRVNKVDVSEMYAERIGRLMNGTRKTIPAKDKKDKAKRNGSAATIKIHPIKYHREIEILVDNIVYVFSFKRKNIIRYYDRERNRFVDYQIYAAIHSMPQKLPSKFCFAHKFFGLNLEWIKETTTSDIIMEDGNSTFTMRLPAKQYRKEFLDYYSHLVVR